MSIAEAPPIELRDYQESGIAGVRALMAAGKKRPILVAPTGSGKRYQAVWLMKAAADRGYSAMLITNRLLLIYQASDELQSRRIDHGLIIGESHEERHHAIQLASIQSLDSRYLSGKPHELPECDLLIVDEAHTSIDLYKKLFAHYPEAKIILFTATPVGPQGKSLIDPGYADSMFEAVKNSELIAAGHLLPTRVFAPSEPDMKGIRITKQEEYAEGQLGRRIQEVTCFANVFDEWAPFADRQTIVFSPSIAYANGLVKSPGQDCFVARGIDAKVISSELKPKERREILQQFRNGELRVLVSVDMLREGFDHAKTSCAIDLQPNAQLRTYWQKIGRVKRPFEDQEYAVYIDMAGNSWRFPHPDDDPTWPAGDETTQETLTRERDNGSRPSVVRCPRCGAVYPPRPVCPECKYEPRPQEIVRRIRMGNGKLREIPAIEQRKKIKTDEDRRRDAWKGVLFAGLNAGLTLSQCRFIHKKKTGDWPSRVPCLPSFGSAEWNMKVRDVYTPAHIMRAFGKWS